MKRIIYICTAVFLLGVFNQCSKDSGTLAGGPGPSGAGGSTARFTIAGNYLYVVDNTSLKTFEINGTGSPVYKSKVELGINIETIFPYDGKLLIGSSTSMYIYSLQNPAQPTRVAKADYEIRFTCDPVVAQNDVAYATLRASGPCGWGAMSALVVYDISDPSKPVQKSNIALSAPYGLGISNNGLYVCEGNQGLRVFDVSSKFNPSFVKIISGETFYDVIPYNNILIAQVENGFVLYDISNRLDPVFISKILN